MNPESERWAKRALDWLERRDDVDASRVGVVAMSLGGYYAPRAAAFEPRLACCIAWGARWDNAGSHGRILRDASAARSVTGWLDHALWYYGAADVDEAESKIAQMTLEGVIASGSPARCSSCTGPTTARCRWRRPSARSRSNEQPQRDAARLRCRRRRVEHVNGDLFSVAIDAMADWVADTLQTQVSALNRSSQWTTSLPTTLADAYRALQADDAVCLAGGQSLVAAMNLGWPPPKLIRQPARHRLAARHRDAGRTAGCASARWSSCRARRADCRGARARTREPGCPRRRLSGDPRARHHRRLGRARRSVGRLPDRTAGGGASIEIGGPSGTRLVAARDFFRGLFETARAPGEIVVAIDVPPGPARAGAAYEKLSIVAGDFAIVAVAAIGRDRLDIAVGGCGPTPIVVTGVEPSDDALLAAGRGIAASCDAPSDHRASAAYRRACCPSCCVAPAAPPRTKHPHDPLRSRTAALLVNGETRDVLAPVSATLLEVVRDQLDSAAPSAAATTACAAPARCWSTAGSRALPDARDRCRQRVRHHDRGRADERGLSRVQQALVDAGAIQCGFCTPGFVMALTALLDANPHPTRDEVRTALSGNLCRCSGYVKIVDAAMRLSEARAMAGATSRRQRDRHEPAAPRRRPTRRAAARATPTTSACPGCCMRRS
jgi:aerobic-type carbon monoxide dehydrogenase small subunit (CoxS/CutS family)